MEEEKNDLNNYMLELADLMSEDQQGERSDKFWKMQITKRGTPGKRGDHQSKNRRLNMKKMDN